MRRANDFPLFAIAALGVVMANGCQQKMADQPSLKPLSAAPRSADGSARQPVPGTVARGQLQVDWALFTGRSVPPTSPEAQREGQSDSRSKGVPPPPGEPTSTESASVGDRNVAGARPNAQSGAEEVIAKELADYTDVVDEFPIPITEQVIEHGRDRYMIYCVVCHDAAGTGNGKIVERGYTRPPSYHIERLRNAPVGHLFRVATLGYGSMPSYAAQVPARDRWAIVAYIRALQLSQHFPEDQLPEELKSRLAAAESKAASGGKSP